MNPATGMNSAADAATDAGPGAFPPIDSYAFLSDTHTGALVAPDGSVEWFCAPHFEGDAIFARLLDRERGGYFSLTVVGAPAPERDYLPETLVLRTHHRPPGGTAIGEDFLAADPDPGSAEGESIRPGKVLIRRLTATEGTVRVVIRVAPRPGYGAREATWVRRRTGWWLRDSPVHLVSLLETAAGPADAASSGSTGTEPELDRDAGVLHGELELNCDAGGVLHGELELTAGQSVALLLSYDDEAVAGPAPAQLEPTATDPATALARTCRSWQEWSKLSGYTGFGQETVRHSARVLRGLAFDETGALLAAPTTSLPEVIGGVRNWDYRFTWHRDAALLLIALFRLGHGDEGRRYLRFLIHTCEQTPGHLAPLVSIRGTDSSERELSHLSGYADSRPVRIGNEAAEQVQYDSYGHVLDAALAYQQLTGALRDDEWQVLHRLVDAIADRWAEPDHGIWEIRGPRRHYVNSKVLSWVCLDRGIRLAELLGDDNVPVDRWRRARDEVHAEVLTRGYDEQVGAFVIAYDWPELDASLLRIPLVGFLPGTDPRVRATIDRIQERLAIAPGLIRRYVAADGLPGEEGAFLLCSFELVSALVLAGRRDEAAWLFDGLLRRAGPLGLFAEQLGADGTALGNYPQAFTHLALIEAAMNLDAADDREALHAWAERAGTAGGRHRP